MDAASIRRRRVCPDCGGRFTTFERVQLRELTVLKKSGRRVPFDRDKLMRSLEIALRKRPVDPERLERMVNGIVRQLESQGEAKSPSDRIGELVMEGLRSLDSVAYVRFRLCLSQFPRGARLQHADRRIGTRRGRSSGRRTAAAGQSAAAGTPMIQSGCGRAVHGRGSRARPARTWALRPKSGRRRAHCQRRRHFGARLDQARRPSACGNRSLA